MLPDKHNPTSISHRLGRPSPMPTAPGLGKADAPWYFESPC